MSPVYHTTLFDTWAMLAAAASPPQLLFQVIRGGDAVHIATFTNMRGAGQLPAAESFEIHKIYLVPDRSFTILDPVVFLIAALVELRIKERTVFSCPARSLLNAPVWSGVSVAVAFEAMSLDNDKFALDMPITIPGGVNFVVEATPQPAALAAAFAVKVMLEGYLTTPD